ncbi:MAG: DUF1932 domain-containing protein [Dehalococcoidia bacterium]
MAVHTVGIMSPGDMGAAVGRALRDNGLDVVTCLEGRSERTRSLAVDAGIRDVPDMESLVNEADLVLSILVPSEALPLAERVAAALKSTGADTAFADCNAVSPDTAIAIGDVISDAGGRYIDAGIIGSPPGRGAPPRFYASGQHEDVLAELNGKGIDVRVMGGAPGRASGIKMCYAALTKGTNALYAATLTAAESLGLSDELFAERESSQQAMLKSMQGVVSLPGKAFRWVGEMEEIAATFESAGVTPKIHLGAADTFRMVAESPLGDERPETVDKSRTLRDTVRIFVESNRAESSAAD